MLVVGDKVRIPRREIVLRFVRSSGPGGQNVQKVASKVVLRWSVVGSPSLAADVRRRFLSRFASRITAEGDLVLACDRHRERERNRVDCLDRLANMLTEVSAPPTPRRRTRAPRRAAERRLKDKRMRAETKRDRRPVHWRRPRKPVPFGPVSERGEMSIVRRSDATVVIRLAGNWQLTSGLPSPDRVNRELASKPPRAVAFDTRELRDWDSAAVTFLAQVAELCGRNGISLDRNGLPEGMQRLLRLAEAVPERPGVRRGPDRRSSLERLGAAATNLAGGSRESLAFLGEVTLSLTRLARGNARLRAQDLAVFVQECGAYALPIVTLISVLVGMILAFVGAVQLSRFGAQIYVADLVAIAMVREMGCIMTGIIMAGRTGSGFAAQLGTMKVTQEIDAFATFGIPPLDFLVLPRLIALVLMMPLLTVYSDALGILGGGFVSVAMLGLTPLQYVQEVNRALTLTSCATGIGKSLVFGALIAVAGCLRGMQCGRSSSAVGDAATSAVVTSIVWIIVADGLFAVIFNQLGI